MAKPWVGEGASRNESEPDSASLHKVRVANLPEVAKPSGSLVTSIAILGESCIMAGTASTILF